MIVRRIETDTGSHIEPAMDDEWTLQQKLEWWAAATELDTGLPIKIGPGRAWHGDVELPDMFTVIIGNSSTVLHYLDAWTYLNGASAAVRALRRAE